MIAYKDETDVKVRNANSFENCYKDCLNVEIKREVEYDLNTAEKLTMDIFFRYICLMFRKKWEVKIFVEVFFMSFEYYSLFQ